MQPCDSQSVRGASPQSDGSAHAYTCTMGSHGLVIDDVVSTTISDVSAPAFLVNTVDNPRMRKTRWGRLLCWGLFTRQLSSCHNNCPVLIAYARRHASASNLPSSTFFKLCTHPWLVVLSCLAHVYSYTKQYVAFPLISKCYYSYSAYRVCRRYRQGMQ